MNVSHEKSRYADNKSRNNNINNNDSNINDSNNNSTVTLNKNFNIPKYKRNITRTSLDCLSFSKLNNINTTNISRTESNASMTLNHLNDNYDKNQLDLVE